MNETNTEEIAFLLDANALARKFYDDIGKNNIQKIFNHPNASFLIPRIGIIETISALLAAQNARQISPSEYNDAKSAISRMIDDGDLIVIESIDDLSDKCIEILEEYKVQEGKSFDGVDSIYIATGREIAESFVNEEISLIFVTSDNPLYRAAKDETTFDTFHFWSCDYGCGHIVVIPKREHKDVEEQTKECPSCGTQIVVKEKFLTKNTCSICRSHCEDCTITKCPSTYTVDFGSTF